jgi:hypothetical protein
MNSTKFKNLVDLFSLGSARYGCQIGRSMTIKTSRHDCALQTVIFSFVGENFCIDHSHLTNSLHHSEDNRMQLCNLHQRIQKPSSGCNVKFASSLFRPITLPEV